jgi:hypothetical protein
MKDATSGPPAGSSARACPVRKHTVITQRAGKDTLLYDPATDAVHLLNPVAMTIWAGCDGRHAPEEIAASLARSFAGTIGRDLLGDVETVLATFVARGLIHAGTD